MLYDCHSIRSVLPRLFDGKLPVFNLGTNDGKSADPDTAGAWSARSWPKAAKALSSTAASRAAGSRAIIGNPQGGVHALQMELSNRGYMREPEGKGAPDNWPTPYDPDFAAPMRATLTKILETALDWARALTRRLSFEREH